MKAVGIIRNVDQLGRVVIPKELRRTLNISEGDPVEILADEEGNITLRKYQIDSVIAKAVSDLHNTLVAFGGQLSEDAANAMHEHVYAMKKLIEKE